MSNEEVNLDPKALLTAMHNNLNTQFFSDSRDDAKQLFNAIADGKQVPFMRINTESHGEIICHLNLDHSQYIGKLNFGNFRKALALLLKRVAEKISGNEDLNVLNSEHGDTIFNVPGIIESENNVFNVLVSGLRQHAAGQMSIRLIFLDPTQYADAAAQVEP